MRNYESYDSYARRRRQREAYAARYVADKQQAKTAQALKAAAERDKYRKLAAMTPKERRAYEWKEIRQNAGKAILTIISIGILLWFFLSAVGTVGHPGWLGH